MYIIHSLSAHLAFFVGIALCSMENVDIDVNDILSESLMPASFLMLDASSVDRHEKLSSRSNDEDQQCANTTVKYDGKWQNAYSTMGFHRKMIAKYMCNHFLANKIMQEVAPPQFRHKIGEAAAEQQQDVKAARKGGRSMKSDAQEIMLHDQGSSNYKKWLTKYSSTLDDINRNYIDSTGKKDDAGRRIGTADISSEEYDEGYVNGTVVLQPTYELQHGHMPQMQPNLEAQISDARPSAASKSVYNYVNDHQFPLMHDELPTNLLFHQPDHELGQFSDGIRHSFYGSHQSLALPPQPLSPISPLESLKKKFLGIFFNHKKTEHFPAVSLNASEKVLSKRITAHQEISKNLQEESLYKYISQIAKSYEHSSHGHDNYGAPQHYEKGSSKEMGLKDLFDIALTTLAFLSFGMFILQVIMCVTMTKTGNGNSLVMMPMEELDPGGGEVEEVGRSKRSLSGGSSLSQINEISRKVLMSIETVLIAEQDQGKCLHQALCENTKYSRQIENNQRLWMPVWSLGLSWLSSRMISKQSAASSILDSLKASAYGLGRADCPKLFPCDYGLVRAATNRTRAERSAHFHIFEWNI